jgi:hypothetical protein
VTRESSSVLLPAERLLAHFSARSEAAPFLSESGALLTSANGLVQAAQTVSRVAG